MEGISIIYAVFHKLENCVWSFYQSKYIYTHVELYSDYA